MKQWKRKIFTTSAEPRVSGAACTRPSFRVQENPIQVSERRTVSKRKKNNSNSSDHEIKVMMMIGPREAQARLHDVCCM